MAFVQVLQDAARVKMAAQLAGPAGGTVDNSNNRDSLSSDITQGILFK